MARSHRAPPIDLTNAAAPTDAEHRDDEREIWLQRSRIVLSPIAPPSILGLFGFFTATTMVGTNLVGWWGTDLSTMSIFPLALTFGGLTQILAAMWSFKARDGLAVAVHGTWGSFWIGWGILQLLYVTGVETPVPLGTPDPGFAIWFVPLCAITVSAALASSAETFALSIVLGALAGGAGTFAAGLWSGSLTTDHVAGWFLVVAAAAAWYLASAMLFVATTGRTILPLGKYSKAANTPLRRPYAPIDYPLGQPGVRVGQ